MRTRLLGLVCTAVLATSAFLVGSIGTAGALTINGTHSNEPAVFRKGTWFFGIFEDSGSPPAAAAFTDSSLAFGNSTDFPLMCDFDGNGTRTPAVFRNGQWFFDNNNDGVADGSFFFGDTGDFPLCGHFTGSGQADQPIIFRNGVWFYRETPTSGFAQHLLVYGDPGDFPVVGDWTNSGFDSPGVVRGSLWILRDSDSSGYGDRVFGFGNGPAAGDFPIVGDWNNNGVDTAGVVRNTAWFLTDSPDGSTLDHVFSYGNPGNFPLAWTAL